MQSIVEAIKCSDVVENRIQLLKQLGDLDLLEKSEVTSLLECLITFWEDFTCLDASQCMLNKTILQVASKYLDSDLSGSFLLILSLASKATQWCTKHLKMTLMSMDESQEEEHSGIFFQLLLDCFSFSDSCLKAMVKQSVVSDDISVVTVEKFILDLLELTKQSIVDAQRIDSFSSEILKAAQAVISSVIQLLQEYAQVVNWDNRIDGEEAKTRNLVINTIALGVEKLWELGIISAKGGGSLVTILNASWKCVITLLQLGKQKLSSKVKIADILSTLITLIHESLQGAATTWSSLLMDPAVPEARKAFLPVKYYLINAVKVSSMFPVEAYIVYKEITACVLRISAFKYSLSTEIRLCTAGEVMTELLDKTCIDLLSSLLDSEEVKHELKQELLDCLFMSESRPNVTGDNHKSSSTGISVDELFPASCEAPALTSVLLLGRVTLFHSILMHSFSLGECVKLAIAKRLHWFLNILTDEEIYSSVLVSQICMLFGSGKTVEIFWKPMSLGLMIGLKTFMIVASSSNAWEEFEDFLLDNFFHPHFLCWEIVMELWGFLMRNTEIDFANSVMDKLCAVIKSVLSTESVLTPGSALRKMARSVCLLLNDSTQSMVDRVYNFVVNDGTSDMFLALLLEGFPLDSLSNGLISIAKQQIVTEYLNFIENFDGKLSSYDGPVGAPVVAFSASLQTLQVNISHIETKTLKFLGSIISSYKNALHRVEKEYCCKLLSETLTLLSCISNIHTCREIEDVVLELQNLFISEQAASDEDLNKCKPNLALFMASLSQTELSENEDCSKSRAVWELYRMLLRNRHWVFVYLAITSFGKFCARTPCVQLWRFVPEDAALGYDLESGKEAIEGMFMSEVMVSLEKRMDVPTVTPYCPEQRELAVKEGAILKEMVEKLSNMKVVDVYMEIQGSRKKRKVPDVICKGVELVQHGLKAFGDGLSDWQPNDSEFAELHHKLSTHFSCLEDVITHLVALTNSRMDV